MVWRDGRGRTEAGLRKRIRSYITLGIHRSEDREAVAKFMAFIGIFGDEFGRIMRTIEYMLD